MILDGNFEETWGDSLHLDTLAEHLPYGKHTVRIELIETHEDDKVPFYLVSVIAYTNLNFIRQLPITTHKVERKTL